MGIVSIRDVVRRLVPSVAAVLLVACGGDERPVPPTNAGRLRLQPVARQAMENLNELGLVRDVAASREGRVYVLDPTGPGILITNARLEAMGQFVQQGSGPGEFREPVSIVVLASGRVAVLDRALARITVLAPDDGGNSLSLERIIPLNITSEAMCVLPDGRLLIYGSHEGRRLHVFDPDVGPERSFAPTDIGLSAMAADLLSHGRIACDTVRDEVIISSRFLPVVEAFRISTGARVWLDTLMPFRALEVTDRGGSVSIASGRAGFSLISSIFHIGDYRVLQTVFESRRDNPTVDTVITYMYSRSDSTWLPLDFGVPLLYPLGDTAALWVEPTGTLDLAVNLSRLVIRSLSGDAGTRPRPTAME